MNICMKKRLTKYYYRQIDFYKFFKMKKVIISFLSIPFALGSILLPAYSCKEEKPVIQYADDHLQDGKDTTSVKKKNAQLIFRSGFEPNSQVITVSDRNADIIGQDLSVDPPNDWVTHLEAHESIGNFSLAYEGGNDTMRRAEILKDPVNSKNNALRFWLKYPYVGTPPVKGRVQANFYEAKVGFRKLCLTCRLLVPEDMNAIRNSNMTFSWFTLMEFWNNAGWTDEPYPFRITLNIQKPSAAVGSALRFGMHGQKYVDGSWGKGTVWSVVNNTFEIPLDTWMKLEIYFEEGTSKTGRFVLVVTPDGGQRTVIHNVTDFTYHPDDPNPNGMTHLNPLKLYTSAEVIDNIRAKGKLTNIYWDDFEVWNDSVFVK